MKSKMTTTVTPPKNPSVGYHFIPAPKGYFALETTAAFSTLKGEEGKAQRSTLSTLLSNTVGRPVQLGWMTQTHSTTICEAVEGNAGECDGLWTTDSALACCALTADCMPILMVGENGEAVAIHAGWRGLSAGILKKALQQFSPNWIYVGTHACARCYEVQDDVLKHFETYHAFLMDTNAKWYSTQTNGRYLLDMNCVVDLFISQFAKNAEVVKSPHCTIANCDISNCDSERHYFSHRNAEEGRFATLIFRA